ncbi:uncharacterized protein JCM15063_003674 [Sporobolomyces koalae]|uniref:uncharacterized protein n=1 Tax=Sporobolomyces koalae TaxID=500713 RepID=UPI00317B17A8
MSGSAPTTRTTRSSSGAIRRFPSSKSAVTSAARQKSTSSKPDAITLLFRREVQSLLSTAPALPSHIPADTPVEVVACVERLSLSGIQQSVQLCQAGDETWVTRTEGARQYFPRAGRVQKRLRGNDDEDDGNERDEEDQDTGRERAQLEPADKRAKKSRKRDSVRLPVETPINQESSRSATSSARRRGSPSAPDRKKKRDYRRSRRDHNNEMPDFDDGASTETERSHLAQTRGRQGGDMLAPIGEQVGESVQLRRGQRKCAGRSQTPVNGSVEVTKVKAEEADDVASLCGRVGGLEFRTTVDPGWFHFPHELNKSSQAEAGVPAVPAESEREITPVPAERSTTDKGKARAQVLGH